MTKPTYAQAQRRKQAVADWVAANGPMCVGFKRMPHMVWASDLQADHITPLAHGGAEDGPIRVLCASCNQRRGANEGDYIPR